MDVLGVILILTVSIIGLFILSHVQSEFNVGYNATILNMTNGTVSANEETVMTNTAAGMNILVASIPFVTLGAALAALVLAFFIPTHPVFLPISLILFGISVVLGAVFSNVLYEFINYSAFSTILAANPLIANIVEKLPYLLAILGLLIIIATYARPRGSWSEG